MNIYFVVKHEWLIMINQYCNIPVCTPSLIAELHGHYHESLRGPVETCSQRTVAHAV